MPQVTWVLEAEAFPDSHETFRNAILAAGQAVLTWRDEWWRSGDWPQLDGRPAIFRGSLANAHEIRQRLPWNPGAYCDTPAFLCSRWYPQASPWLLNRDWRSSTVAALVEDPRAVLSQLGNPQSVFVRPDSPLKPFSGRVLDSDAITLKALDHGFYFDDANLPVVVAPVRAIGEEWRYVVASRRVVAGSRYGAQRDPLREVQGSAAWQYAAIVARNIEPPEDCYVMDICESAGELRLLELNPFSGANLYGCSLADVVAAVSDAARGRSPR